MELPRMLRQHLYSCSTFAGYLISSTIAHSNASWITSPLRPDDMRRRLLSKAMGSVKELPTILEQVSLGGGIPPPPIPPPSQEEMEFHHFYIKVAKKYAATAISYPCETIISHIHTSTHSCHICRSLNIYLLLGNKNTSIFLKSFQLKL